MSVKIVRLSIKLSITILLIDLVIEFTQKSLIYAGGGEKVRGRSGEDERTITHELPFYHSYL